MNAYFFQIINSIFYKKTRQNYDCSFLNQSIHLATYKIIPMYHNP